MPNPLAPMHAHVRNLLERHRLPPEAYVEPDGFGPFAFEWEGREPLVVPMARVHGLRDLINKQDFYSAAEFLVQRVVRCQLAIRAMARYDYDGDRGPQAERLITALEHYSTCREDPEDLRMLRLRAELIAELAAADDRVAVDDWLASLGRPTAASGERIVLSGREAQPTGSHPLQALAMPAITNTRLGVEKLKSGRWVGHAWITRAGSTGEEALRVDDRPSFLFVRDAEDYARDLVIGVCLNVPVEDVHRQLVAFPNALDGVFRGKAWIARPALTRRKGSHWGIAFVGTGAIDLLASYVAHPGAARIERDALQWLEDRAGEHVAPG